MPVQPIKLAWSHFNLTLVSLLSLRIALPQQFVSSAPNVVNLLKTLSGDEIAVGMNDYDAANLLLDLLSDVNDRDTLSSLPEPIREHLCSNHEFHYDDKCLPVPAFLTHFNTTPNWNFTDSSGVVHQLSEANKKQLVIKSPLARQFFNKRSKLLSELKSSDQRVAGRKLCQLLEPLNASNYKIVHDIISELSRNNADLKSIFHPYLRVELRPPLMGGVDSPHSTEYTAHEQQAEDQRADLTIARDLFEEYKYLFFDFDAVFDTAKAGDLSSEKIPSSAWDSQALPRISFNKPSPRRQFTDCVRSRFTALPAHSSAQLEFLAGVGPTNFACFKAMFIVINRYCDSDTDFVINAIVTSLSAEELTHVVLFHEQLYQLRSELAGIWKVYAENIEKITEKVQQITANHGTVNYPFNRTFDINIISNSVRPIFGNPIFPVRALDVNQPALAVTALTCYFNKYWLGIEPLLNDGLSWSIFVTENPDNLIYLLECIVKFSATVSTEKLTSLEALSVAKDGRGGTLLDAVATRYSSANPAYFTKIVKFFNEKGLCTADCCSVETAAESKLLAPVLLAGFVANPRANVIASMRAMTAPTDASGQLPVSMDEKTFVNFILVGAGAISPPASTSLTNLNSSIVTLGTIYNCFSDNTVKMAIMTLLFVAQKKNFQLKQSLVTYPLTSGLLVVLLIALANTVVSEPDRFNRNFSTINEALTCLFSAMRHLPREQKQAMLEFQLFDKTAYQVCLEIVLNKKADNVCLAVTQRYLYWVSECYGSMPTVSVPIPSLGEAEESTLLSRVPATCRQFWTVFLAKTQAVYTENLPSLLTLLLVKGVDDSYLKHDGEAANITLRKQPCNYRMEYLLPVILTNNKTQRIECLQFVRQQGLISVLAQQCHRQPSFDQTAATEVMTSCGLLNAGINELILALALSPAATFSMLDSQPGKLLAALACMLIAEELTEPDVSELLNASLEEVFVKLANEQLGEIGLRKLLVQPVILRNLLFPHSYASCCKKVEPIKPLNGNYAAAISPEIEKALAGQGSSIQSVSVRLISYITRANDSVFPAITAGRVSHPDVRVAVEQADNSNALFSNLLRIRIQYLWQGETDLTIGRRIDRVLLALIQKKK